VSPEEQAAEFARLKKAMENFLTDVQPILTNFGTAVAETVKAFGKVAEQLTQPPNRGPW
jgi:hypothetical protein